MLDRGKKTLLGNVRKSGLNPPNNKIPEARYDPDNPEVREVLGRKRDVRMSIDARLEVQVLSGGRRLATVWLRAAWPPTPSTGRAWPGSRRC